MTVYGMATRTSLTLAAVLFLASGMSVLSLGGHDAVRDGARDLATHVARQLDAIGRTVGELRVRAGAVAGPLSLPAAIAGAPYHLEVRADDVRVVAGGVLAVAALHEPVHPFAPDRDAFGGEELTDLDRSSTVVVGMGEVFLVERAKRRVDSVPTYLTFVYLPH